MRQVSKKRARQNAQYKKIRLKYLEENPLCERCGKMGTEIHHKAGRNGERLLDDTKYMTVDRVCHQYIHNNSAESYEKGWLLSK